MSKEITSAHVHNRDEVPAFVAIAKRIKAFRQSRGWNQTQLAEACGVTQSQVSRWEKNLDSPSTSAFGAIARLADDSERDVWIADAGMSHLVKEEDSGLRVVPILKDSAAAGTPRAIDERNIEMQLGMPSQWLPRGGKLYGIKIVGDSMAPTVNDGNIVLVDVARRRPQDLVGRMVAARDGDGVTVKWLRRDGEMYFLVPQHTSERHPIRIMRDEGNWSLVGEVVKIIGDPPAPKRK